jgi:hypothetical protein
MKIDSNSIEELLTICRVRNTVDGNWCPCIRDRNSHDINPVWVAAVLFAVYDRYLNNIDDASQHDFATKTLKYFNGMIETGPGYVEKINL